MHDAAALASRDWERCISAFNALHLHVVQSRREVEVLLLIFKWFGSWSLKMSRGRGCRGYWLAECSLRSCNIGTLSVTVCTCQALPLPATPTTLLFLFWVEWVEGRVLWAVAVCVPAVICNLRVQGECPWMYFIKLEEINDCQHRWKKVTEHLLNDSESIGCFWGQCEWESKEC